jgi:GH24 family phage-related lysozyme (muramidase)
MNLDELREEIAADEGVKYEIYRDHIGYKTLGIGHLCIAGVDAEYDLAVGTPVSVERVNELFDKDIKRTIADCKIVHDDFDGLPDEVQKILANMCFQMGLGRFMKFHNTHDLVKKRFWDGVSQEMLDSRWAEQTPERAQRLSKRMAALAV